MKINYDLFFIFFLSFLINSEFKLNKKAPKKGAKQTEFALLNN